MDLFRFVLVGCCCYFDTKSTAIALGVHYAPPTRLRRNHLKLPLVTNDDDDDDSNWMLRLSLFVSTDTQRTKANSVDRIRLQETKFPFVCNPTDTNTNGIDFGLVFVLLP